MLKIDNELQSYIPALKDAEYTELEKSILLEGIREPITVWGETIVDGHNRHKIALEHVTSSNGEQ